MIFFGLISDITDTNQQKSRKTGVINVVNYILDIFLSVGSRSRLFFWIGTTSPGSRSEHIQMLVFYIYNLNPREFLGFLVHQPQKFTQKFHISQSQRRSQMNVLNLFLIMYNCQFFFCSFMNFSKEYLIFFLINM